MNAHDMMHDLIHRAKNLTEYTITTEVPADFRFNGLIPFDMNISGGMIEAKVWGIDFDEAVHRLNDYLETCK